MDPTLVGVLLTVAFGLFVGAVAWLRCDIRRVEARLDRIGSKVDGLVLALARAGFLVDPQAPKPSNEPAALALVRWTSPPPELGGSGSEG